MIACVGEESRLPGRDPAQPPESERDALDQRLLDRTDRLELGSHRLKVPLPGFPFVRQNACRDAVFQGVECALVLRFLAHGTPSVTLARSVLAARVPARPSRRWSALDIGAARRRVLTR
jgi:hypothetical protein